MKKDKQLININLLISQIACRIDFQIVSKKEAAMIVIFRHILQEFEERQGSQETSLRNTTRIFWKKKKNVMHLDYLLSIVRLRTP